MAIKIGINGFGRIGKLCLRAAFDYEDIEIVHINDPGADAAMMAHLINVDSVHGLWHHTAQAEGGNMIVINGHKINYSQNKLISDSDWSSCDIVIESSGRMRKKALLQGYLDQGVKHVVVSAPVKEQGVLNVVMGVNDALFEPAVHSIVTAASCTTNCLAPVVKVMKENFSIRHASMTTIHSITNTQTILDRGHKDPRRARACGMSLIPTSTGSATAITEIFPELKNKINGHAVRVPLSNASLTDCVFELEQMTDKDSVNKLFAQAAEGALEGILGYEERPLVSIDYRTDPRSAIVDGLSTMVINSTQVKLYVWYDNEWGYANRTVDLVRKVASYL